MTKDIYTIEEKEALLKAIKATKNKETSVAALCRAAGLNPNRGRFIMDVLVGTGRVERTVTKTFNERYTRYAYSVRPQ